MLTTGSRRHADHVTNAPQFTRATLIKLRNSRFEIVTRNCDCIRRAPLASAAPKTNGNAAHECRELQRSLVGDAQCAVVVGAQRVYDEILRAYVVADTKSAVAFDSDVGVVERVQLDQRVRNVMLARDFVELPAVEIGVAVRVAVVGINGVVMRCVSGCRVRCLWPAAPGDRCSGLTDDAVGQGASRSFGGRD